MPLFVFNFSDFNFHAPYICVYFHKPYICDVPYCELIDPYYADLNAGPFYVQPVFIGVILAISTVYFLTW